jgi:hypothetical protein
MEDGGCLLSTGGSEMAFYSCRIRLEMEGGLGQYNTVSEITILSRIKYPATYQSPSIYEETEPSPSLIWLKVELFSKW